MKTLFVALLFAGFAASASAQFVGPSRAGVANTVAGAQAAGFGTYVTLTGQISTHLGENYYLFRDDSGEIRIEIEREIWSGRRVGPDHMVRIHAEIDRGLKGRYLWVKSLELLYPPGNPDRGGSTR